MKITKQEQAANVGGLYFAAEMANRTSNKYTPTRNFEKAFKWAWRYPEFYERGVADIKAEIKSRNEEHAKSMAKLEAFLTQTEWRLTEVQEKRNAKLPPA